MPLQLLIFIYMGTFFLLGQLTPTNYYPQSSAASDSQDKVKLKTLAFVF